MPTANSTPSKTALDSGPGFVPLLGTCFVNADERRLVGTVMRTLP